MKKHSGESSKEELMEGWGNLHIFDFSMTYSAEDLAYCTCSEVYTRLANIFLQSFKKLTVLHKWVLSILWISGTWKMRLQHPMLTFRLQNHVCYSFVVFCPWCVGFFFFFKTCLAIVEECKQVIFKQEICNTEHSDEVLTAVDDFWVSLTMKSSAWGEIAAFLQLHVDVVCMWYVLIYTKYSEESMGLKYSISRGNIP